MPRSPAVTSEQSGLCSPVKYEVKTMLTPASRNIQRNPCRNSCAICSAAASSGRNARSSGSGHSVSTANRRAPMPNTVRHAVSRNAVALPRLPAAMLQLTSGLRLSLNPKAAIMPNTSR